MSAVWFFLLLVGVVLVMVGAAFETGYRTGLTHGYSRGRDSVFDEYLLPASNLKRAGAVQTELGRPDRDGRDPGTGRDGRSPDEPSPLPPQQCEHRRTEAHETPDDDFSDWCPGPDEYNVDLNTVPADFWKRP